MCVCVCEESNVGWCVWDAECGAFVLIMPKIYLQLNNFCGLVDESPHINVQTCSFSSRVHLSSQYSISCKWFSTEVWTKNRSTICLKFNVLEIESPWKFFNAHALVLFIDIFAWMTLNEQKNTEKSTHIRTQTKLRSWRIKSFRCSWFWRANTRTVAMAISYIAAKFGANGGGGTEKEVIHLVSKYVNQLHCLQSFRLINYYKFYYFNSWTGSGPNFLFCQSILLIFDSVHGMVPRRDALCSFWFTVWNTKAA